MDFNSILHELVSQEEKLFMVIGGSVVALWISMATLHAIVTSFTRERTKREIAAYIAEGTMSPEQGERILKANGKQGCA